MEGEEGQEAAAEGVPTPELVSTTAERAAVAAPEDGATAQEGYQASPEEEVVASPATVADLVSELLDENKARPDWMQALDHALAGTGKDSFEMPSDVSDWPIEAKRLLYNTLVQQRKSVQDLDAQLKKRDDAGRDLEAEKLRIKREKANVVSFGTAERLRKFVGSLKSDVDNPYSPEGLRAQAKNDVAEVLTQFLDTWKAEADAQAEEVTKAEAADARQKQLDETLVYMRQFPEDFEDDHIYGRIESLMKRSNYSLTVKEAHELVMGQLAIEQDKANLDVARLRARNRIRPGSGKTPGAPPTPSFKDSGETLAFYQDSPDALKRDYERAIKLGTSY